MKKIKIFLGAYVNFPNAQNINCDNIAKYIDKEKFDVHVMYTNKKKINKQKYRKMKIHLHKLIHHRFIWYWAKYLTMLFGNYDIYYLPKMEDVDLKFVKGHKNDAVFISSIEGVVGEQIPGNDLKIKESYINMDSIFSISECVKKSVKKYWSIDTEVLYLGIEPQNINDNSLHKKEIKNIIWIGSIIDRKRPEYFVACAKHFPKLNFVMVGDGKKQTEIEEMIKREQLENIQLTGRLSNEMVYDGLRTADLLLMTSDKEGLPKVIGEAMELGVPTIYINEYYKVDYIKNGVNGYAVANIEGMIEKIQYLLDNSNIYQKMSKAAFESIQPYTWDKVIKQYEMYFEKIYMNKKKVDYIK